MPHPQFPLEIPDAPHRPRIIPVLLIFDGQLYKTVRFRDPKYVGDPRNAVRIFNDLGADELVILDVSATRSGREPDISLLEEIASEAFMPVAYGGGIGNFEAIRQVLRVGIEKVVLCTAAHGDRALLSGASEAFGAQSVVGCIDVRRQRLRGSGCFVRSGAQRVPETPAELARAYVAAGVGEILVNSIDRDGTFKGYDVGLMREITASVDVPVIACGGAESYKDLARVVRDGGVSAAAAGSLFVFQRPHRAVLITFPTEPERASLFPDPVPPGP